MGIFIEPLLRFQNTPQRRMILQKILAKEEVNRRVSVCFESQIIRPEHSAASLDGELRSGNYRAFILTYTFTKISTSQP